MPVLAGFALSLAAIVLAASLFTNAGQILFTRWELEPLNLFSVVLALASGSFVYVMLRRRKTLRSWHLMVGGVFYLIFLAGAVFAVL